MTPTPEQLSACEHALRKAADQCWRANHAEREWLHDEVEFRAALRDAAEQVAAVLYQMGET